METNYFPFLLYQHVFRAHLSPHYSYLFVELSSIETRVFLQETEHKNIRSNCFLQENHNFILQKKKNAFKNLMCVSPYLK